MTLRATATLGAALAALLAWSAVAETEDLEIRTSEGKFLIELYDDPEVDVPALALQVAKFRRRYPLGSHSFFHRGENECTICFFCDCGDDFVCQGDELARSCQQAGESYWQGPDGGECAAQSDSICFFCECVEDLTGLASLG